MGLLVLQILGIIALTCSATLGFFEKMDTNGTDKPTKWATGIYIVAILGFAFSIISAIWTYNGAQNEQEQRIKAEAKYDTAHNLIMLKEDTIRILSGFLKVNTDTLLGRSTSIILSQNRQLDSLGSLMKRSISTMKTQTALFKVVTGDGNRPTVIYLGKKINSQTNQVIIGLKNESKYPIHSTTITVHEIFTSNGKLFGQNREYPAYELPPGATKYFFNENKPIADNPLGYGYALDISWSMGYYGAVLQVSPRDLDEKGYLKATFKSQGNDHKAIIDTLK